ncbi:hypothetical protein K435DRAFT_971857 [Dendrothele bispora CBS 962.96]|uniref:Uncharacterized protein n=1 Tax=Dendrothele bispora (strain CBS 962.96) TaxID=1314807 RepID=A0A4S8L2Q2_DENBC|nr:hypothetical protein K435DRAFT_971857 [Dendrothele bispora CBS 962.96]
MKVLGPDLPTHIEPVFVELSPSGSIEAIDIECCDSSVLDIKRPAKAHYCCCRPQLCLEGSLPLSLWRKAESSPIPNIEDTISSPMNAIPKLYKLFRDVDVNTFLS